MKKKKSLNLDDKQIDRLIYYIFFFIRSNKNLKYIANKWDNLQTHSKQEAEFKLKYFIECILQNDTPISIISMTDMEFINSTDITDLCHSIKLAIKNIFITDDNVEVILIDRIYAFKNEITNNIQQKPTKKRVFFKWRVNH